VSLISQAQAYPLLHALGRALLHSLWEGAALAMLLAASLWLMRGRSPAARYAVACAALALMLLLPSLTAWGLSGAAQGFEADEMQGLPAAQTITASTSQTSERVAVESLPTKAAENPDARRPLSEGRASSWLPWLTLLWLAGVCVLSARMLGGLVCARRLRRRCTRAVTPQWQARAEEISRRLRVSRPVKIFESALVRVPTAVGWLRPVILLPASAFTGLTPGQLEAIIAHELAHIRRHDYLFNLLQTVAETLLFYHPAAWWVSRRVRTERELVCDDLAVEATGDALTYARALTQLERLRKSRPLPRLALAAGGGDLRARVLRLVGAQPRRRGVSTFAAGLFFVAAFFTTVACTRAILSQKESERAHASQTAAAAGNVERARDANSLDEANSRGAKDSSGASGVKDSSGAEVETLSPSVASLIADDNVAGEDAEVRRVAIEALGAHAGAVVVMNPKTGQVYAVVNQEWALRRGWIPASTLKLVTSLAGLGENLFDPSEKVRVRARAERLDLTAALAVSDNDYFRSLATRVGAERIIDYAARLGLGERTGINYEGETAGRLPAAASVASAARLGLGEGVEVTPVQLAVLVSAIANGGTLVVPTVARTPGEAAALTAQTRRRLDIAPATLAQVSAGMLAAVGRGTASGIKDSTLKIAGKTGTLAGKYGGQGLFVSYAPADDPRLAVVVLTSGEGERGYVAAQIAGTIYESLRARL
jgi:beta-lactamase regulating signal transducer with metallopeptidase domain